MGESHRATILLVTYYWPPSAGPGVQRWLKMSHYLAEQGFRIIVYTPQNPDVPLVDESLLGDVAAGIEVLRTPIVEPQRVLRRLTLGRAAKTKGTQSLSGKGSRGAVGRMVLWLRANLLVPDARALWIAPSVRYLRRYLSSHPVDAIITTGPPHSMHCIGERLHRRTGVRWVADFRDPWLELDYMQHLPLTKRSLRRHQALEKRVIQEADRVLVVSPEMQRIYQERYQRPIALVYNGYDERDFLGVVPLPPAGDSRVMRYCGDMNADRVPYALLRAWRGLLDEGVAGVEHLRLECYGRVCPEFTELVESTGLTERVEVKPPVPHAQVPQLLSSAEWLLLLINRTHHAGGILTGKLFEYMASGRPTLCIGPVGGDAASLLRECGAGVTLDFDDVEGLARFLGDAITRPREEGIVDARVGEYSRRGQAAVVGTLIDGMLGEGARLE